MLWAELSIKEIKETKLLHHNWINALNQSFCTISACSPGEVVCITGPSRVGKSRLITELKNKLDSGDDANSSDDMPVLSVVATNNSTGGAFSTKSFTLNALEAIKLPTYILEEDSDWQEEIRRKSYISRATEATLRATLEGVMRHRRVCYFVIDEAQQVAYVSRGIMHAKDTLDSWKCLAQTTGAILVLVGAYPILDVLRSCPHICGRKQLVHFPRYSYEGDGFEHFSSILRRYSSMIPRIQKDKSLVDWGDLLYEGSLGCIGLLESWLRGALANVWAMDDSYLGEKHLIATRRPAQDIASIANEIYEGEKSIDNGLYETSRNKEVVNYRYKNKRKSKRRPFQKLPKRYSKNNRE